MSYIGDRDFFLEIQKGNVPGHSMVGKFGQNTAVPNGTWAAICEVGALNHLTTTSTIRVKAGGDATDTSGGAGAQGITVQGIDDTLAYVEENLALAGASAGAAGTLNWWRPVRAFVTDVGTYGGANAADIVVEVSAGGTDLIQISAGEGQSQFAAYTVPQGKTAYLVSIHASVSALKPADIRLIMRENFNDVTTPYSPDRLQRYWPGVENEMDFQFAVPLKFEALTDIWLEARGDGFSTEVSASFHLILVDD